MGSKKSACIARQCLHDATLLLNGKQHCEYYYYNSHIILNTKMEFISSSL